MRFVDPWNERVWEEPSDANEEMLCSFQEGENRCVVKSAYAEAEMLDHAVPYLEAIMIPSVKADHYPRSRDNQILLDQVTSLSEPGPGAGTGGVGAQY